MRWLVILVVAASALWSGWWVVGRAGLDRGVTHAIAEARAVGWQIAYDDLSISGFPNRFDTTVTAAEVTTPDNTIHLSAPFLRIFALAYRPNHVIAVAPNDLAIEIPGEVIDVTNDDLRASVIVSAAMQPVLDRTTLTAEALRIAMHDLWVDVAEGRFATRQSGDDATHDVALTLTDVGLSQPIRAALDGAEQWPETIAGVHLDSQVALTDAIGPGRQPVLSGLTLRRAEILWGDTRVNLTGDVTVSPSGLMDGTLTLTLVDWDPLMLNAVAQGMMTPTEAILIGAGISGLAGPDGAAQIPITLTSGQLSVLGLPPIALPRL